ncbi:MAG: TetR/AcrR family transcriptional regulator [Candidatus Binatia bacterium]
MRDIAQTADQAEQTRDRILATASRLFSARGYDHTPLSHVAREAQVSKALILWHFDSKEKLFQAALGRTLEPYFINTDDLSGLDEQQQIERLIDAFYEFVRANVYSVRFLFSLIIRGEQKPDDVVARLGELYAVFRSLLTDIIERGGQSGRFRRSAHPRLDASLILAALGGILIERFMDGEDASAELLSYLKKTALQRLIG